MAKDTTSAKDLVASEQEKLSLEIDTLVNSYNKSIDLLAFPKARELSDKIAAAVAKFNAGAERACFAKLRAMDNPMLEAAKQETFVGVAVREKKKDGQLKLSRDSVNIQIDPLRLYEGDGVKHAKVGTNPKWPYMIQSLSAMVIVTISAEYGQKPRDVWNALCIDDATRELGDRNTAASKKRIEEEVKNVIEAMIGTDYVKIPARALPYLRDGHTRKGGPREIKAIKPRGDTVRKIMMDLCKCAIEGTEPVFTYDQKTK